MGANKQAFEMLAYVPTLMVACIIRSFTFRTEHNLCSYYLYSSFYLLGGEKQRRRLVAVPLLQVPPGLGIPAELHQVALVRRDVCVDTPRPRLGAAAATATAQQGRADGERCQDEYAGGTEARGEVYTCAAGIHPNDIRTGWRSEQGARGDGGTGGGRGAESEEERFVGSFYVCGL